MIGGLAVVLVAIAVAGVFNTVVLNTREKVRDVAILEAVGMGPRQVVAMVVASASGLGLVAGLLGIPLGLVLHARVLDLMGQVASGTGIPPGFYDVIAHRELPALALAGVIVAAAGAWLPARWAARAHMAEVLQAEGRVVRAGTGGSAGPPARPRQRLIARSISRRASASASACRLSYCRLPRARPISTFAWLRVK